MSLLHQIALTFLPGVGDVITKKLLSVCGSPEAVFTEKPQVLLKAERVGDQIVNSILAHRQQALKRAAEEIEFVSRYNIQPLFFTDAAYPSRLRECIDGPALIYYKGSANLNHPHIIAMVGTRRATNYGKEVCQRLIGELKTLDVLVISGLAYGIDTCAHKAALDQGLGTIAVLAHGLDRIYPPMNKPLAQRMLQQGGLLTDFPVRTNPDRENFPSRNRIIAGLADAVVVVEAGKKGGALITADIANSYNRDVFAVPGNLGNTFSEGCNFLIKTNRAVLVESAADIKYIMGWGDPVKPKAVQKKLMIELSPEEEKIIEIIQENGEASIDRLCNESGTSPALVAKAILSLELEGIVKTLPGKMYKLL